MDTENQIEILPARAALPTIITASGPAAPERFLEFFAANIRNPHTRPAYARQVMQFLTWCEGRRLTRLGDVLPLHVASYIETMPAQAQTVKQALAAIRMLFDWLVIGPVVPTNPAGSVRGPKYSYRMGKMPVLSRENARALLDSIDTSTVIGLRDRALIGLMVFSFVRISAVLGMQMSDYYQNGRRSWIRLHEKGGKFHEVPVHHNADDYLHAYIEAAGIADDGKQPLWRTARGRTQTLTPNALQPREVLAMIKRRAKTASLPATICNHTG